LELARTKHLSLEAGELISSRSRLFEFKVAGVFKHLLLEAGNFFAQCTL
jgi:hypothetical protein